MTSRGVVLFAHNTDNVDYWSMAVYTANRANRFLGLPVTIITDERSIGQSTHNTITIEPDRSNSKHRSQWFNKGRYQVYHLSPYDETLILDTDYMINSATLLQTFEYSSDIVCHNNPTYLLENTEPEKLGQYGPTSAWATVIRFKKTQRTRGVFRMMQMIQENYEHYSQLYGFQPYSYRNDYALTIALRTLNGGVEDERDYLHWPLLHCGLETTVERQSDTSYRISRHHKQRNEYIIVNDTDFHMLHKQNYKALMQ